MFQNASLGQASSRASRGRGREKIQNGALVLLPWILLSKTNTAFTDYTCNCWVNFCNITVKSQVSKPTNLYKLLVFFIHRALSRGFASLLSSRQAGQLDCSLLHFSFMKPIFRGLSCQLKLFAFFLAIRLFVNVFAVQSCPRIACWKRLSALWIWWCRQA